MPRKRKTTNLGLDKENISNPNDYAELKLPNHKKVISDIKKEYGELNKILLLSQNLGKENHIKNKIVSQVNKIFNKTEEGIKSIYTVENLSLIDKVKWAKSSFEEISYDIEAIISRVIYPGDSPYSRKTAGGFVYTIEFDKKTERIRDIDTDINTLLDGNEIETQMWDLLDNLISYGFSYVYFYNGYSKIMVLSNEDLEIISVKDGKKKRGAYNISMDLLESKVITNITKVTDVSNIRFKVGETELDPNYLYIVTNKPGKI